MIELDPLLFEKLEQKGFWRLLIYLAEKQKIKTTELRTIMKSVGVGGSAFYTALGYLIELGLAKKEVQDYPLARFILITEKGKRVVELFNKVLEVI